MRCARLLTDNLLAASTALLLLSWPRLTSAAVVFVTPAAGSAIPGLSLDITWQDDGNVPLLTDLTDYKLFLCAGGNTGDSFTVVAQLTTTGLFTTGNTFQAVIPATVGGTDANAYFLQMISDAAAGGTLTSYSTRFSIPSATGKFTDTQLAGLKAVAGSTAGPQGVNNVVGANKGPAQGDQVAESFFSMAWADQTGVTRYAPMQPIPPNKMTKKNPTPQHPTSQYILATTWMAPPPAGQTTISQIQTASFSQRENPIASASPPNPMQKYLNRWRD